MSQAHQIFFDATGKRRIYSNLILSCLALLLATGAVYTSYYLFSLAGIHRSVSDNQSMPSATRNNSAILYNNTHKNGFKTLYEQLKQVETIILPTYTIGIDHDPQSIDQKYVSLHEDVEFLSATRNTHYERFLLMSSKDYNEQPVNRQHDASIGTDIQTFLSPEVVQNIAKDVISRGANGIIIDIDLSLIKNQQLNGSYQNWIDQTESVMDANDLKLGFVISTESLNNFNRTLFANADVLYITQDYGTNFETQATIAQSVVSMSKNEQQKVIYELPSVSSQIDSANKKSLRSNFSYGEVQNKLLDKTLERSLNQVNVSASDTLNYQVSDAISAFNYISEIRSLSGAQALEHLQFAVSDPGFEEYSTWSLLNEPTADSVKNQYSLLEDSYATLDLKNDGAGQIYTLEAEPKLGKRTLEIDATTGLVTKSTVTDLSEPAHIKRKGHNKNQIALTFDDGPHPVFTKKVLDVLDRYNVKGTFFVTGDNVTRNPEITREIVKRGHEVENHTYTHPYMSELTPEAAFSQIQATTDIIQQVTSQQVSYFRIPYSHWAYGTTPSDVDFLLSLKKSGLEADEYDIDSKDWELKTSDEIVAKVINDIATNRDTASQILLHDAHENTEITIEALPRIIEYLQAQDFDIVPVSQLGKFSNPLNSSSGALLAIRLKQNVQANLVWINTVLIIAAMFRYFWIFSGAWLYVNKNFLRGFFLPNQALDDRDKPEVAVLISCYNEEAVIKNTINAVFANTYKNFKLVIVNDGSTDQTAAIVKRLKRKSKYKKQMVFYDRKNEGKAKALEYGIRRTKSKWIIFCDADTIFAPDTIEKFVDTTTKYKKLGAVAGKIQVGNAQSFLTRSQVIEYGLSHILIKSSQDASNMITVVPGALGMWNRKALMDAGGFSSDTLAEDADTTMRLISLGYAVKYRSDITARTEAPESFKMLYKQRTRWQLGNLQSLAKHRRGLFRRKYGTLGFLGMPLFYIEIISALVFPMLFVYTVIGLIGRFTAWEITLPNNVRFANSPAMLFIGAVLLFTEFSTYLIAIAFENTHGVSRRKLFLTIPYYVTVYKLFMSYSSLVALSRAIRGTLQGWGHLKRTASVELSTTYKPAESQQTA